MELAKDAYRALEDVVGPEYISQDPAIRDTYNQVWGNKLLFDEKWSTRPAAVLLPETTEEVQSIVRACNRFKIPFKPFSSGFEIVATALESEKAIILDLRRMDKIIEFDPKNCHAVVEPFVSVYKLQMEATKHGLTIGNIGAGPEAGVIASHVCHLGTGSSLVYAGGLGRNVLGCEWVLPTGEVLKMGSAEAGGGWYSADGPGFSLRGVLRGRSGANGGHGVITKCSAKLYHWYGPSEWELKGSPPALKQLEDIPDGFKAMIPTFRNWSDAWEAMRDIAQAEIAFSVLTTIGLVDLKEGNDEFWEEIQHSPPELFEMSPRSLLIVLGANTPGEMEYREKVLGKIVEKWQGEFVPALNDHGELCRLFGECAWSFRLVRAVFRTCTDMFIPVTTDGSEDMMINMHPTSMEVHAPYAEKGIIMAPGALPYHTHYENGGVGTHIENAIFYDPFNKESLEGTRELINKAIDPHGKFAKFGVPLLGGGLQIEPVTHVVQNWGPQYDNYHLWLAKIKDALDPNNLGDWTAYVPPIFP